MDDWENEDFEPIVNESWDDEDDDKNVKGSWDDDEEEEEQSKISKSYSAKTSPPVKKKKTLVMKIAEREEAERKRKEGELHNLRVAGLDPNETPEERKAREQKQVLEADLQNAKDLFGDLSVKPTSDAAKTANADLNDIFSVEPKTKPEFEELGKKLTEKLLDNQKSAHYILLVEILVRELCTPLSLDDTRKVSTIINSQINEKQKAFSNKKKKSSKKATLKGVGSETANYELYAGEYDDFM